MTDELIIKLQKLWKRIDEEPKWYDKRDGHTKADKKWVVKLIKDVATSSSATVPT